MSALAKIGEAVHCSVQIHLAKLTDIKRLTTLSLLRALVFSADAKIGRVNNNTGIAADFTTAQPAHDGAAAGGNAPF